MEAYCTVCSFRDVVKYKQHVDSLFDIAMGQLYFSVGRKTPYTNIRSLKIES